MSKHQKKMEAVLDLLINEENSQAADLLHQIIVEKSRDLYEDLVDEKDLIAEDFGEDPKDDFASDIEADSDEIEGDEEHEDGDSDEMDDEEGGDFEADEEGDDEEGDGSDEDRLDDLELALDELRSEFDQLMSQEMEEPNHDFGGDLGFDDGDEGDEFGGDEFGGDEFGGDDEVGVEEGGMEFDDAEQSGRIKSKRRYEEDVYEATKLQDQRAGQDLLKAGNKEEGKFSGTGKNSVSGETFKQSPYTNAPSKSDHGGKPINGTDGSKGKEQGLPLGSGTPPVDVDNIDVKSSNASKPSNDAKDDAGSRKSPLSHKPKKKR